MDADYRLARKLQQQFDQESGVAAQSPDAIEQRRNQEENDRRLALALQQQLEEESDDDVGLEARPPLAEKKPAAAPKSANIKARKKIKEKPAPSKVNEQRKRVQAIVIKDKSAQKHRSAPKQPASSSTPVAVPARTINVHFDDNDLSALPAHLRAAVAKVKALSNHSTPRATEPPSSASVNANGANGSAPLPLSSKRSAGSALLRSAMPASKKLRPSVREDVRVVPPTSTATTTATSTSTSTVMTPRLSLSGSKRPRPSVSASSVSVVADSEPRFKRPYEASTFKALKNYAYVEDVHIRIYRAESLKPTPVDAHYAPQLLTDRMFQGVERQHAYRSRRTGRAAQSPYETFSVYVDKHRSEDAASASVIGSFAGILYVPKEVACAASPAHLRICRGHTDVAQLPVSVKVAEYISADRGFSFPQFVARGDPAKLVNKSCLLLAASVRERAAMCKLIAQDQITLEHTVAPSEVAWQVQDGGRPAPLGASQQTHAAFDVSFKVYMTRDGLQGRDVEYALWFLYGERLLRDATGSLPHVHVAFEFVRELCMTEPAAPQPHNIQTRLRLYQRRALHWMLRREMEGVALGNHPGYFRINDQSGQQKQLYASTMHGVVSPEKPDELSRIYGGILADEMGLGKSLEVISLIEQHRGVPIVRRLPKKLGLGTFGRCSCGEQQSEKEFTQMLSSFVYKKQADGSKVHELPTGGAFVACDYCGIIRHVQCEQHKWGDFAYCSLCTDALFDADGKVETRATLIVAPNALMSQWVEEVRNHSKLRIFVYNGLHAKTPGGVVVRPHNFCDFDVVLTNFDVLRAEVSHQRDRLVKNERRLRHEKKYRVVPTPLTSTKFWRVIIDECQMVASSAQVADIAGNIPSHYRWCVSGTPIPRSIHDLGPVLQWLGVEPYSGDNHAFDKLIAEPFESGLTTNLETLCRIILWRTSKVDVDNELNLPTQHTYVKYFTLSHLEQQFYNELMRVTKSDLRDVIRRGDRVIDDARDMANFLVPFQRLRHACSHPQLASEELRRLHALHRDAQRAEDDAIGGNVKGGRKKSSVGSRAKPLNLDAAALSAYMVDVAVRDWREKTLECFKMLNSLGDVRGGTNEGIGAYEKVIAMFEHANEVLEQHHEQRRELKKKGKKAKSGDKDREIRASQEAATRSAEDGDEESDEEEDVVKRRTELQPMLLQVLHARARLAELLPPDKALEHSQAAARIRTAASQVSVRDTEQQWQRLEQQREESDKLVESIMSVVDTLHALLVDMPPQAVATALQRLQTVVSNDVDIPAMVAPDNVRDAILKLIAALQQRRGAAHVKLTREHLRLDDELPTPYIKEILACVSCRAAGKVKSDKVVISEHSCELCKHNAQIDASLGRLLIPSAQNEALAFLGGARSSALEQVLKELSSGMHKVIQFGRPLLEMFDQLSEVKDEAERRKLMDELLEQDERDERDDDHEEFDSDDADNSDEDSELDEEERAARKAKREARREAKKRREAERKRDAVVSDDDVSMDGGAAKKKSKAAAAIDASEHDAELARRIAEETKAAERKARRDEMMKRFVPKPILQRVETVREKVHRLSESLNKLRVEYRLMERLIAAQRRRAVAMEGVERAYELMPASGSPFNLRSTVEKLERDVKSNESRMRYFSRLGAAANGDVDDDMDPCVICFDSMIGAEVMVPACGHMLCKQCVTEMLRNSNGAHFPCPTCRADVPRASLTRVRILTKEERDAERRAKAAEEKAAKEKAEAAKERLKESGNASGVTVFGSSLAEPTKLKIRFLSYPFDMPANMTVRGCSASSKLHAIISSAKAVLYNDPSTKIIVFSEWTKMLQMIGDAMNVNEIGFVDLSRPSLINSVRRKRLIDRRAKEEKTLKGGLARFRLPNANGGMECLLMSVAKLSAGLTLTEATHVFICEPGTSPGRDLQALGRVHRLGQTRETFVHRFICRNSVEEKLYHFNEKNRKNNVNEQRSVNSFDMIRAFGFSVN